MFFYYICSNKSKHMKKLLFFISLCLMINHLDAQNEMWIYKSNGSVVKYNTAEIDSIKFMPIQEPSDETIYVNATQLIGTYYGDNIVGTLGHYWIIFTDGGIVDGVAMPNTEYFRLDILGPLAADEENIRIPNGHYSFDANNEFNNFSIINIGSTDYVYIDEAGEAWSTALTSADLFVEDNTLILKANADDKEYEVTFIGDYNIEQTTMSEHISTLTSDYEISLNNCTGTVKSFGDYWNCGLCNWQVEFLCNDGLTNGTYLVLDFLTDTELNGSSGFEGTYRSTGFSEEDHSRPDFAPYTFIPGFRVSVTDNYMLGSMLVEHIDGTAVEQAPLFDGEFTIKNNNDGTHTIIINATDDAKPSHKITLNWTGKLK